MSRMAYKYLCVREDNTQVLSGKNTIIPLMISAEQLATWLGNMERNKMTALLILKNMVCTEKWLGEARDIACKALEKQIQKVNIRNGEKSLLGE